MSEQSEDPELVRSLRAVARRERKRREELEAALAEAKADVQMVGELRMHNTMLRSGVDIDSAVGAALARTYDGELSPGAVQRAYADYLSDFDRASSGFAVHVQRTMGGVDGAAE